MDKHLAVKEAQEKEQFLRDIEQDFDLRCQIHVYKDPKYVAPADGGATEDEDDAPQIPDEELIDEKRMIGNLAEMKINDTEPVEEDEDEDIDLMNEDI